MLKWNRGGNAPSLNMKKYLITQDTICNGQRVSAGDVVDITEDEGFNLIACNKAEVYDEKPKAKKTERNVGLETSEVKAPKKRAKK